jgi:drug/metabolite transporter (DMT)-like permease
MEITVSEIVNKYLTAQTKVVGMTQCLYPICSAFFAAIIIKEMLTVPAIIGCALISCAVFAESFIE